MSKLLAALAVIFLVAVVLAASWCVTVGLIYLICMLFGWTFKVSFATGIWLILIILRSLFYQGHKD